MADSEGGTVSRHAFQVAYDGVSDTHSMDVQELAPALIAFGRLIRETNAQLNAKKATVRVLVRSDFEHRCFNISFEVIQNIIHQIAEFFQTEEIKSARQILVDLGIIGGASGLGLFSFLKWKKGRQVSEIRDSDQQGIVIVQLGDGNTAHVSRDAIELARNSKVRSAVEGTLAPLGTNEVTKIVFKEDEAEIAAYDESDSRDIIASFDIPEIGAAPEADEEPDTITAWLRVYSPVYDERADKWRFLYGDHAIYADITETGIARDAIARGGALVNDLYKVKMEVKQHFTKGGSMRLDYKIISVIDFRPAPQQNILPLGDANTTRTTD
jgi:hypothetical protein